ncbi:tail fiber assembly protein [Aeromonas caviae]
MNEPSVTWDQAGFAQTNGWVMAHCTDAQSEEYIGEQNVWVSVGTGLPAGAFLDVPPPPQPGKAIVRRAAGWELVVDYRGQTAYSKANRAQQQITAPGDLPDTLTLLAPSSQFDVWDDALAAWVTDVAAESAWNLEQATVQRTARLAEANQQIAVLADAVELGMATEEEQAAYTAWRQYRVLLTRLDPTLSPVPWPPKPNSTI